MEEKDYMPAIRENFAARVKKMGIHTPKALEREAVCYLQGVLSALTATNVMTMGRAGQIAFLVMVGRGVEFLMPKEVSDAHQ